MLGFSYAGLGLLFLSVSAVLVISKLDLASYRPAGSPDTLTHDGGILWLLSN